MSLGLADDSHSPRRVVTIRRLRCGYASGFEIVGHDVQVPLDVPVVLKGENGSGKTTLLKALARLDGPDIFVLDIDGDYAFYYVEQTTDAGVFMSLTVEECIAAMARTGRSIRSLRQGVRRNFEDFLCRIPADTRSEVQRLRSHFVEELSGGQRALLGVAAGAVAAGNRILLLDEPAAHLDHNNRRIVAGFIRQLVAGGRAVWTVSHDEQFTALLDGHHSLVIRKQEVISMPLQSRGC